MAEYIATAPFTRVQIDIAHDQDWYDELPQLLEDDGKPVDLAGATLTLTVRPLFDHTIKIKELTNGSGIVISDAANGFLVISLARAQVDTIPVGRWDQFLVLDQPAKTPRYREIWRGPLIVHPARI